LAEQVAARLQPMCVEVALSSWLRFAALLPPLKQRAE
jgi:hypothetical protein